MAHALVTQLRFSRREFERCLRGVSAEEAVKRIKPLNCLSWIVGHMASHEQYIWLKLGQDRMIEPDLEALVGFGQPASTPSWDAMWKTWREITSAADVYLEDITDDSLDVPLYVSSPERSESVGISLLRNVYHYWHHIGEAHAIRQVLGHTDLPVFVGRMDEVSIK